MDSWKLRDTILKSLSQWYLILAVMVVGGVIGLAMSYLVPAPYRATQDIYLGIDVSRVNEMEYIIPLAEEEPLNLDDYKNWQLKQAADILKSDQVLNKALKQLQENGQGWEDFTLADFRKAADIYWYDAGTWRLEVTLPQKDQAVEAVEAWMDSGHAKISELLEISHQGYDLDQEIWTINLAISDQKRERARLITFTDSCQTWITQLEGLDGSATITSTVSDDLQNWLSLYSSESSYWQTLLADSPDEYRSNHEYVSWLEAKLAQAADSLDEIQKQMDILQAEKDLILPAYQQYLADSLGLSSNLVLLPDVSAVGVERVYETGSLTIGGACLGLLAWILFAIMQIRSQEEGHGK
jgi:hypothetical protein